MEELQKKHEQAVGDAFIKWYNAQNRTVYAYHSRGADPPDLVYRSCEQELLLEISTAWYDSDHATMTWQNARRLPGAVDSWNSSNPDQKLIASINSTLAKKSKMNYPSGCVLIIAIYPNVTSSHEFIAMMPGINVPAGHSFADIYVGGQFPTSKGSAGGYFWWTLSPKRQV